MRKFISKMMDYFGYRCIEKKQWLPIKNITELRECDVENCQLIATRERLLELMPKQGVVAEIGVGLGDSTEQILKSLKPKAFYALDTFGLEKAPIIWGKDSKTLFSGLTHEQFYCNRFSQEIREGTVKIRKGLSWDRLVDFENSYFDFIFIDAGHDYSSVKRDAFLASQKIKDQGYIMFNDYIMFDHLAQFPYGVIPVVNEMCVNEGFEMIYFGLQSQMFCDVVLRRKS